jgi:hypothetical protein
MDIYAPASQGFGFGYCNNVQGSGASLPADVRAVDCSSIHQAEGGIPPAQQINCNTTSPPVEAYLLNQTAISGCNAWWGSTGCSSSADNGYPSRQDVQAACDLFSNAGFQLAPSGSTCAQVAGAAQGTAILASYPHLLLPPTGAQIIFYDRTEPRQKAYGQIVADSLNFIFGTANNGLNPGVPNPAGAAPCAVNYGFKSSTPGCTPAYYGFSQISNIICGDGINPDAWNLYTSAIGDCAEKSFGLTPDYLYRVGNSLFASNQCGSSVSTFISNYEFSCDPYLDTLSNAGEFSRSFQQEVNIFQNASYIADTRMMAVPMYSLQQTFIALNCLNFQPGTEASLVNGLGTGWLAGSVGGYYTLLNAHANPGFTPANSAYTCGGGDDDTIRRGQSQDSDSFSPYQATSAWDFDVINEIWDSMLGFNPGTAGPTLQSYYQMAKVTSLFNPVEASISPGTGPVVGTTRQTWQLRPDASFQDGIHVTADDVCFSILTYRDMPSALLLPDVVNVASCTALNPSTALVTLGLNGINYETSLGEIPILPHHVWAAACNWPVGTPEPSVAVLGASACATSSFDPMLSGLMIGSGPYECIGLPGSANPGLPGGSCAQTASGAISGQSNTVGGHLLLTANPNYYRGPVALQGSNYQKFSWADKFDTGLVTISDIADAALHFKHYDPYWASPVFSSSPATCSATGGPGTGALQCVDIGDIATAALYFGVGAVTPIPLALATGLDPHIDRFDGLAAPIGGAYYLGSTGIGTATVTTSFVTGSAPIRSVCAVYQPGTGTNTCPNADPSDPAVACTTSGAIAPDGPGRSTYTCTFPVSVTEVEFFVTWSSGATSEIHVGTPS